MTTKAQTLAIKPDQCAYSNVQLETCRRLNDDIFNIPDVSRTVSMSPDTSPKASMQQQQACPSGLVQAQPLQQSPADWKSRDMTNMAHMVLHQPHTERQAMPTMIMSARRRRTLHGPGTGEENQQLQRSHSSAMHYHQNDLAHETPISIAADSANFQATHALAQHHNQSPLASPTQSSNQYTVTPTQSNQRAVPYSSVPSSGIKRRQPLGQLHSHHEMEAAYMMLLAFEPPHADHLLRKEQVGARCEALEKELMRQEVEHSRLQLRLLRLEHAVNSMRQEAAEEPPVAASSNKSTFTAQADANKTTVVQERVDKQTTKAESKDVTMELELTHQQHPYLPHLYPPLLSPLQLQQQQQQQHLRHAIRHPMLVQPHYSPDVHRLPPLLRKRTHGAAYQPHPRFHHLSPHHLPSHAKWKDASPTDSNNARSSDRKTGDVPDCIRFYSCYDITNCLPADEGLSSDDDESECRSRSTSERRVAANSCTSKGQTATRKRLRMI